jgi:anti-anti-sigma factor
MVEYSIENLGTILICHVNGEININTYSTLDKALHEMLAQRPFVVAIDFSNVYQIDLTGISGLVKFSRSTIIKDVELILYGITDNIEEIFALSGLSRYFNILSLAQFEEEYL